MAKQRWTFSAGGNLPSEWVNVDGRLMPPGGEFRAEGAEDQPDVSVVVGYGDGEFYLREVRLTARDGRSRILDEDLRTVARQKANEWAQWIMANLPTFKIDPDGSMGAEIERTSDTYFELRRAVRTRRGRAHLAEVAEVYRAGGRKGAKAVAEHFGVEHRTAQLWVRRARDERLLGPARKGVAGEAPQPARKRSTTRRGAGS